MSHLSQSVAQGVRFVISIITDFGRLNFPGTDIPIFAIAIGAWAIYFFWRWWISHLFDMETKK